MKIHAWAHMRPPFCSHRGVRLPYDWCETCFTHLGWLLSSVDNPCNQFGPRSGCTKGWAWSGSKFFDTDSFQIFCFFLEQANLKKDQQTAKASAVWSGTICYLDSLTRCSCIFVTAVEELERNLIRPSFQSCQNLWIWFIGLQKAIEVTQ